MRTARKTVWREWGVWLANDSRDAAGLAVLLGAEVDKVDGEAEDGHGRGLEVLRLLGVLLDDGDLGLLLAGRVRVDKGAHGGRKLGRPRSLSRTQPPATRSTTVRPGNASADAASSTAKMRSSCSVSATVSPLASPSLFCSSTRSVIHHP